MPDLLDWADVSAVGILSFDPEDGRPLNVAYVARLLEVQERDYLRWTHEDPEATPPVLLAEHRRISAALREAFDAGRRSVVVEQRVEPPITVEDDHG